MAEIVNLRRVRKAKVRAEAVTKAEANRTQHGASKPIRKLAKAQIEKLEHHLSAHKLDES